MNCAGFKERVAAFVLDALEPEERSGCEAHLAQPGPHEGCERAYREALETVAKLSAVLAPAKPSPTLWSRIEARVAAEAPPVAPRALEGAQPRPRRAWREGLAWGLAAAAAAAFLVTNGQLHLLRRESAERTQALSQVQATALASAQASNASLAGCREQVASLQQGSALQRDALALMDEPGSRVVKLAPQPGKAAQATAILNVSRGRAILVSAALSPQPDRDYELWIIRGKGAPIPAGLVRFSEGGIALAEFDRSVLAPGAPDAFAVSLEPRGGSASPTDVLMVGAVRG